MIKTNLVFIHGFCFNSNVWNQQMITRLREKFIVKIIDIPGLAYPTDKLPTLTEFAKELNGQMEAHTHNILVGHSMGGYLALEMIYQNPQLFNSILLINSHPFGDDLQRKEKRTKSIAFIQKHRKEKFLHQFYKNMGLVDLEDAFSKYATHLTEQSIIHYLNEMKNRSSRVEVLKKKTLGLLLAEQDDVVPFSPSLNMLNSADLALLKTNPGGHLSPLEYPDQIEELINEIVSYNLSLL